MSKKLEQQTNEGKNFNFLTTQKLPKLRKVKTNWDLKGLYYKSDNDPQIEKDLRKTEKEYNKFVEKWRQKDFTENSTILKEALQEYQALSAMPEAGKPMRYFSLRSYLDAKDETAQKNLSLIGNRLRKVGEDVIFFSLKLGLISIQKQKQFLEDKTLSDFHYYLKRVWLSAKHNLSEAEEKIISLKSKQSYGAWVNMVDKIISNRSIKFKGKNIPVNEALETLDLLGTKDKALLWNKLMTEMEQVGEIAEHEFNAIIYDVSTEDELRGYKKPYSATALSYEDTEKSIENLVAVVSDKGFALSKKFYQLKAEYHGVKKLHYTRKYDSIGQSPTIDFQQATEICRDVFYGLKKDYGLIFDRMLENGQIDAFPAVGKSGGAFMSGTVNQPTHVFLNHMSNFKSLETLAHEMGHAIHTERSKSQIPFYQGHSTTTAETASTLFENLLYDAVYEQASKKERTVLLHDKIARDIATIQRQIACFNAELEIHQTIKKQGAMTNEELRDCLYKHLKAYVGPAVNVEKEDGYSYVYWSHLRYGFYVYTYTFGILMSTIMANHYKKDRSYIEQIDKFLCAGEANDVSGIFKSIGIKTGSKATFESALKNHENDINDFAKIVKQKRKK